ncbi:MAG: class I SAM-dependent methyltransferase [Chloracidobacterium sp.]|nr:class I SAM-dependent methyltransferase [Chloracidobacterium sp.]
MESQYTDLNAQYATKAETYYELSRPEMIEFVPESAKEGFRGRLQRRRFWGFAQKERPGVEVWGIEPSTDAAASASQKLDKVIHGTFQAGVTDLEGQRFDCIVFNDVLEHLVNPEIALNDSKKYLSDEGVLVASIPNILHFYQIWSILKEQDWKY